MEQDDFVMNLDDVPVPVMQGLVYETEEEERQLELSEEESGPFAEHKTRSKDDLDEDDNSAFAPVYSMYPVLESIFQNLNFSERIKLRLVSSQFLSIVGGLTYKAEIRDPLDKAASQATNQFMSALLSRADVVQKPKNQIVTQNNLVTDWSITVLLKSLPQLRIIRFSGQFKNLKTPHITNPRLTHLICNDAEWITDKTLIKWFKRDKIHQHIKVLNLDRTKSIKSKRGFVKQMQNIRFNQLEVLSLVNIEWISLPQLEYWVNTAAPNLKTLLISGETTDMWTNSLILKTDSLKEVDLSYSGITDNKLQDMLENCTNLSWLVIQGCDDLTSPTFTKFGANLTILDCLGASWITNDILADILMCCPKLKQLNLASCTVAIDERQQIVGGQHLALEVLDLSEIRVMGKKLSDGVLDKIVEKTPNLKKLNISGSGVANPVAILKERCKGLEMVRAVGCENRGNWMGRLTNEVKGLKVFSKVGTGAHYRSNLVPSLAIKYYVEK
eukprot:TRINITY_DN23197_c0_g1_i1.p1 TRINITY_DN23197_c0_g1~~TRINITY_DN23197_c0_g1_i1.p1  ORF type:complete len:500 (-),score=105.23 TRINITY_DN23197_c0_g1_i1:9-1508(-)